MSSLFKCIPNVSSYLPALNTSNFLLPPPETMFAKSLTEFSSNKMDKLSCLEQFRIVLEDHFKDYKGDIFAEGRSMLQLFEGLKNDFGKEKVDELKADFTIRLAKVVEEEWAKSLAKEFFPIPDLKEESKQIAAADSFSKRFLEGAAHLAQLKGSTLDDLFVAHLIETAQTAFETESRCVIDQKLNNWIARANNALYGIPQDDINLAFQDSRGHFPWIDRGRELLKDICTKANALRTTNITDASVRNGVFKMAFQSKKDK